MGETQRLEVASRITRVTVYARGALVRRVVALPAALPEGPVELVLRGVTARANANSVRAFARGGREVRAVRAAVHLPSPEAAEGALAQRCEALLAERRALQLRRGALQRRREALGQWQPVLRLGRRVERGDPPARVLDAIAASGLVSALQTELDDALAHAQREGARLDRELEEARAALEQGLARERAGARLATLDVAVALAEGPGAVRSLAIEYAVGAARWWPAYTVRVRGGAGASASGALRARWTLEAQLAQDTGEDWTDVALRLSTADLLQDARLPELPELRLGRAQPPVKKGYRAPPAGLDALFEAHDRALGGANTPPLEPPAPPRSEVAADHEADEGSAGASASDRGAGGGGEGYDAGAEAPSAYAEESDAPVRAFQASMPAASAALGGYGGAPPPAPKGAPQAKRRESADYNSTRAGGLPPGMDAAKMLERLQQEVRKKADAPTASTAPSDDGAHEPGERWANFDLLELSATFTARATRGRLRVRPAPPVLEQLRREAERRIEALAAPAHAQDPARTRGRFDHRYEAQGALSVPSDARAHHVAVCEAEGEAKPRFRTVPREAAEVYREAEATNPFDAPLLAGPVELYIDDTRASSFVLSPVDRGGAVTLGLGVEERLRVARNAKVHESTAGLLGGSTVVEHAVTIELASALGHPAVVEVLDRLPVSDDKDVEVTVQSVKPRPEAYAQAERGQPVRGGARWRVEVPAGGRAQVDFAYRVTLPSKSELVGGNRRE